MKIAVVKGLLASAQIDKIIADLDAGTIRKPKDIRAALEAVRQNMEKPDSYLSPAERAEILVDAVQTAEHPLQFARSNFGQDFLANYVLPSDLRLIVAAFLWNTFGVNGNPIWKHYIDGTFRYIPKPDESEF